MKVDFVIIGAQKSGTTSLAYQLAQHPGVSFCRRKEPHYFSKEQAWRRNIHRYHSFFEQRSGKIYGEASTSYSMLPEYSKTHERLFEYNPEMKIIYIMRHPIERIVSHLRHRKIHRRESDSPEIALLKNPIYVNRSRYSVQIGPYIELFSRKNVHLLIFEHYIVNPARTVRQVFRFLNLPKTHDLDFSPRNISSERFVRRDQPGIEKIYRIAGLQKLFQNRPAWLRFVRKVFRRETKVKELVLTAALEQNLRHLLDCEVAHVETLTGHNLDIWRRPLGN